MAFDKGLAERIRESVGQQPGITERKMLGGLCFMVDGIMCFGIVGSELVVRVGPDATSRPWHSRMRVRCTVMVL